MAPLVSKGNSAALGPRSLHGEPKVNAGWPAALTAGMAGVSMLAFSKVPNRALSSAPPSNNPAIHVPFD